MTDDVKKALLEIAGVIKDICTQIDLIGCSVAAIAAVLIEKGLVSGEELVAARNEAEKISKKEK